MNTMRDLMLVLAAVSGCMTVDLSGDGDVGGDGRPETGRRGSSEYVDGATGPGMDGQGSAKPVDPDAPGPKPQPCHEEPCYGDGCEPTVCQNVPWQEAVGMLAQGYCDRCEFGVEGCYERVFAELQPQPGEPEPLPVCLSDWYRCEVQMDEYLVHEPGTTVCGEYPPLTACAEMFVMP